MDWELFANFILELRKLKYSSWLALHNYNEPLANQRILKEIQFISETLPESKISIFTNGDYLDINYLDKLLKFEIAYMRVTLYPHSENTGKLSYKKGFDWLIQKRLDKLLKWKTRKVRQGLSIFGIIGKFNIEIIIPNLKVYNWRGGTAPSIEGRVRTYSCYMTSHSASIDYRGQMKMCCNIFSESTDHKKYIVGSLRNNTFIDLWWSSYMHKLRSCHLSTDWSLSPICEKCTQSLPLIIEEKKFYKRNFSSTLSHSRSLTIQ